MATAEKDIAHHCRIEEKSFSSTLKAAIDLSTNVTKVDKNIVNRYFYSVGTYNFLLEDNVRAETINDKKINEVPYLPKWHEGIISIRGVIMPVINIHAFLQAQMKNTNKTVTDKSYLLKLEHEEHPPIVFKVDKLPEMINIKNFKTTKKNKNTPDWIQHYLTQGSTKIAHVNHKGLFEQIIQSQ
jgi:chemotaxis signal transduction protein